MRQTWLTGVVASITLASISADAKDVSYPQDAPLFTIAVPETWKPIFLKPIEEQ